MITIFLDGSAEWRRRVFSFWNLGCEAWSIEPRDWRWHLSQVGWRPRLVSATGGNLSSVAVAMPPRWLKSGWPLARRILTTTIARLVGDRDYILVLTSPDYARVLPHLVVRPRVLVYYAYDDYRANRPRDRAEIEAWERALIEEADLVIAAARYRADSFRSAHPDRAERIHHLPVGVDPLFVDALERMREVPNTAALSAWPRPRFVYFGSLTERTDFRCFADVADRFPDGTVILAGRPPRPQDGSPEWWRQVQAVLERPNVQLLGWVPDEDIPSVSLAADVLLMAHTDCDFNRGSCPAKFWDYLATGHPIVATPHCPEVSQFPDLVYFGQAGYSFGDAAASALAERVQHLANQRRRIASNNNRGRLGQTVVKCLSEFLCHTR